jgi:predicted amidohydrolase YtcJ
MKTFPFERGVSSPETADAGAEFSFRTPPTQETKQMKKRGLGAGSDVPVTPMTPWWGSWSAVVRRELTTGEILAPEERLSIREALTLYTRNGAYIGFEEKSKGSLEHGKLADFIVVDRDVLKVPSEELKDVQVIMTFVGGGLSYKKTQ